MNRLFVIFATALTIGVFGLPCADAAHHKKFKAPAQATEVQGVSRPAARPSWAAPGQCLTDDGYGRFLPCALGDGK